MKLYSRLISVLLVLTLVFSLSACGTSSAGTASTASASGTAAAASDASAAAETAAPTEAAAETADAAAEEAEPVIICPFTVNGTEMDLGMTYADCMSALEASGITASIGDFRFSSLRIGCEPSYLKDVGSWITGTGRLEGSGSSYSTLALTFIVAMPEDFDENDQDVAVALIKESGKLLNMSLSPLADAESSLGISEFTVNGLAVSASVTGEQLNAFAQENGMESNDGTDYINCYTVDSISNNDFLSLRFSCQFTDSEKTSLSYFYFEVGEEYFMAKYF